MGPFLKGRRSIGLKVAAIAVVLCFGAGVARMLWLPGPGHKITGREVLRDAVAEWKRDGARGGGPNWEIFEQQASQGYYDDAAETARLYEQVDSQHRSVLELARLRTENGDAQGAKNMIKEFTGSDLGAEATKLIALAQAENGDLPGALETSAALGDSTDVWLEFGRRQIKKGDLEGALKTVERMKSDSAYQLFYDVGDALRMQYDVGGLMGLQGDHKRMAALALRRVDELAAHMSDRKLAALFKTIARFTFRPPEIRLLQMTPCERSYDAAYESKFAEADSIVEEHKCSSVATVPGVQYVVDPAGAERLVRTNANPRDLNRAWSDLATAAGKKGNIPDALRFLDEAQHVGPSYWPMAMQEVARLWTIKDGPKPALKWAHARPDLNQRTWALLGIAEALGHARPQR